MKKLRKTQAEIEQDRLIMEWKTGRKIKEKIPNHKPLKDRYKKSIKKLRGKSYKKFINSGYWRMIRCKVIERDGFKCVKCSSKENLQVHHLTYKNHFNEHNNLADMQTLCKFCHKKEHIE